MNLLKRFMPDQNGNIALMTGLAIVPLMLGAGVVIDLSNMLYARTALQAAADVAALAASANPNMTDDQLKKLVLEHVLQNGSQIILEKLDEPDVDYDKSNGTFSVSLNTKLNTSVLQLFGFGKLDIGTGSVVSIADKSVEVALVLDNTASMSSEGRMDALKAASKLFLAELKKSEKLGTKVKVSIVPFAQYVNVGMENRNKTWMDVPADSVEEKDVTSDDYSKATKSDRCHDESGTWNNDGVMTPYAYTWCEWDNVKKITKKEKIAHDWHGCVGSRGTSLQTSTDDKITPYPGLIDRWCSAPVVPLTSNFNTLEKSIDGMWTNGLTYIPSGLLWGWNTLTDAEPFDEAKEFSAKSGGRKVLMLMTDGNNTVSSDGKYHEQTNASPANATSTELCDNIKKDGIEVYTVALKVDDVPTQQMLANCATSATHNFEVSSNAELLASFQKIGDNLAEMRLAR